MSGDPGAIRTAAAAIQASGDGAALVHTNLRALDVETWDGWAANAFRGRRQAIIDAVDEQEDDPRAAATILNAWADQMADADASIDAVRTRMRAAWDALIDLPPDLGVLPGLMRDQRELATLRFVRERGAIHAADELYALIAADTSDLVGLTWPPDGWPPPQSLQTVPLSSTILDTATFDPLTVNQGQIGDCYLLASLMALMQTDEGDQLLRDNITWDPALNGYWVTLYDDGDPVRYFVDRAQAGGARQDGAAGIASIYEAAMKEHLTFGDLTNGGWPVDTFPIITGHDADELTHDPGGDEAWDTDALRDKLDDGEQLVASTGSVDSDGAVQITVNRPDASGALQPETVDLHGPHSYAVAGVEPDGSVWVMNPWGAGNGADGGGAFLVSAADFNLYFNNVGSSGGN